MALLGVLILYLFCHGTALAVDSTNEQGERARNSSIPPIVLFPSQYWEGNDGAWSTFSMRVGNPDQYVRAMISTNAPQALVVLSTVCSNPTTECLNSRGGTFNISKSKTWNDQGGYTLGLFEANLGYTDVVADFGLDKLGLGLSDTLGPTLGSQVIAASNTGEYNYGMLGLSVQPTNFTNFADPQPSFFTSLYTKGLLPSLSWSYTAGAKYRDKGVFASLVFGGYDSARFTPNSLSFNFAGDSSRELVVGIQSIVATISNGTQYSLLPNGLLAFVDSTLPYLWLPIQACQAFEHAFGLEWNSTAEMYFVSDVVHETLLDLNPTVVFKLGNTEDGGAVVSIALPYASFDLNASSPLVEKETRYFPLKRAANDTQYTLGRAFLQEAYLIADYEQQNFSISQCSWDPNVKSNIIAISSEDSGNNNTAPEASSRKPSSHHLQVGAIAGIAVAAVASLGIMALLIYGTVKRKWFSLRLRRTPQDPKYLPELTDADRIEKQELDGKPAHLHFELDGKPGPLHFELGTPQEGNTIITSSELGSDGSKYELPTPPAVSSPGLSQNVFAEAPGAPVPVGYLDRIYELRGSDPHVELPMTRESGIPAIQVRTPPPEG